MNNTTIDTYGYIYSVRLKTSNLDLLQENDDDDGHNQFFFNITLLTSIQYNVIATTYGPNVLGSFSIIGTGPGLVYFSQTRIQYTCKWKCNRIKNYFVD